MTIPEQTPIITLKDVWDRLDRVNTEVNRGLSAIKADTDVLKEQFKSVTRDTTDHETRIRLLEQVLPAIRDLPGKADALEKQLATKTEAVEKQIPERLSERLVKLENARWQMPGIATAASVILIIISLYKLFT